MLPNVSVVVPVYNGAKTLVRALDSIASQNYDRCEVIVVDDGSTDDTLKVASGYDKIDIRIVRHDVNRGLGAALNTGIRAASHDLVALLDADDEWLAGKLHAQALLMSEHADLTMSATASEWVNGSGKIVHRLGYELTDYDPAAFWKVQYGKSYVAQPTVMARKAALIDAGLFDETLKTGMDQCMWLRLMFMGKVMYLNTPYLRVHLNDGSMTSIAKTDNSWAEKRVYEKYLPELEKRAGAAAARELFAARMAILGKDLCGAGDWPNGVRLIAPTLFLGIGVPHYSAIILKSSPPARFIKRLLKPR